ncbi:I78 family peptidase inhibitor [Pseudomonas sp. HS6]|uniref:I78 family peptidase inhibitor n=1 Tax=Pseudomonas sp. HS6 TaxID=2850559 RepID=UPI00201960F2|nr:I78 family peptidase inhibitor [Pseudomonas sp. HS6]UQS16595.1 hypothetical protein JJN09_06955 [Pseudomonas sp. HS6]
MSNVWVYKLDGAVQCHPEVRKTTLAEARKELSGLIGGAQILGEKTGSRIFPSLCGLPEGTFNAFEITEEGWILLSRGIAGPCGFNLLEGNAVKSAEDVSVGQLIGSLVSSQPQTISQLVGHPLRVYKTGDGLTRDWIPQRCNIELNESGKIVSVWFG